MYPLHLAVTAVLAKPQSEQVWVALLRCHTALQSLGDRKVLPALAEVIQGVRDQSGDVVRSNLIQGHVEEAVATGLTPVQLQVSPDDALSTRDRGQIKGEHGLIIHQSCRNRDKTILY